MLRFIYICTLVLCRLYAACLRCTYAIHVSAELAEERRRFAVDITQFTEHCVHFCACTADLFSIFHYTLHTSLHVEQDTYCSPF